MLRLGSVGSGCASLRPCRQPNLFVDAHDPVEQVLRIGYCRVCGKAAADFEVLQIIVGNPENAQALEAGFEGGREGFVNRDELHCLDCLPP